MRHTLQMDIIVNLNKFVYPTKSVVIGGCQKFSPCSETAKPEIKQIHPHSQTIWDRRESKTKEQPVGAQLEDVHGALRRRDTQERGGGIEVTVQSLPASGRGRALGMPRAQLGAAGEGLGEGVDGRGGVAPAQGTDEAGVRDAEHPDDGALGGRGGRGDGDTSTSAAAGWDTTTWGPPARTRSGVLCVSGNRKPRKAAPIHRWQRGPDKHRV